MNTEKYKLVDILVVEDNPGDILLIKEVLKHNMIYKSINIVKDGLEAMHFLHRKNNYSHAPRPDLILLDLNLPKLDGREVLEQIKSDDNLRLIPVVIMTMSKAEEDVARSYQLHANCYVTKPLDFDQFVKVVESIEDFWFSIVKLPHKT